MNASTAELPVVVIGAGPAGLTAAAHLARRNQRFLLLESGPVAGHAISQWGHVQVFSPWRYCLDTVAAGLLEATGWTTPDPEVLATGDELVSAYLQPLAQHPAIAPNLRFNARVLSIAREGIDKVRNDSRAERPFEVVLEDGSSILARAVIDASGTWSKPNPAGANGLPAAGESAAADHIRYGLPDVLGGDRERYSGKRTLVVGSGHSAINDVLSLLRLREASPETRIAWALRSSALERVYGGGSADALPARGALGSRAREAIEAGAVELLAPFRIRRFEPTSGGLDVQGDLDGEPYAVEVDEVIVATGFRPDLGMLSELRLDLDPALESSAALGPLIDPNFHSCGTVPPHGYRELTQPEPGFFVIGAKSYGRAPTFLMATGFEQARSVVAHLAGDDVAASRVELVLPETGVCSSDASGLACCSTAPTDESAAACCGGPALSNASACCVLDEDARASGLDGCGCGTEEAPAGATTFVSLASL